MISGISGISATSGANASAQNQGSNISNLSSVLLALRFALRELRGGLSGFYIFLACIALGVAAISGVNSVARSITQGIGEEGQQILGGDVAVSLVQQEINPEQSAFLEGFGATSKTSTLRAMGRLADGSDQTLIELKAVDDAYPLFGTLTGVSGNIEASALGENQVLVE